MENKKKIEEIKTAAVRKLKVVVYFLIFCVIFGVVFGFVFNGCEERSTTKAIEAEEEAEQQAYEDKVFYAKYYAQEIVEQNLKAPSTAEFPWYDEMTAKNSYGDVWTVTGYVDAENSFGAMIRQNFWVELTLTETGYTDGTVSFYD